MVFPCIGFSGTNKLVLHSNNNVLTAGTWSYVTVTYDASQGWQPVYDLCKWSGM